MASDCAALGVFSKLIVQGGNTPRTFSSSSEAYSFVRESMQSTRPIQGRRKIVGIRDNYSASLRQHSYVIAGELVLQPGPADLTNWIPRIFGGTFSSGTLTPGETLPAFDMMIDRENEIFLYTNCQVAKAIFSASSALGSEEEELVELQMVIVAETETKDATWPDPAPSLANTAAYVPYGYWEGALTLNSNSRQFDAFNLMVDNNIFMRARNSLTPNCIRAGERVIRLQTSNPFTSAIHDDAYSIWGTGVGGALAFTSGNMSTTFTFPHLRNTYNTPNVRGKGEIPVALSLEAARTASDPVVTITHDATL